MAFSVSVSELFLYYFVAAINDNYVDWYIHIFFYEKLPLAYFVP